MKHIALLLILAITFCASAEARDRKQVYAFRRTHPCPSTGLTTGACRGYVVDHKLPLCSGAIDAPSNMQWQGVHASRVKDGREITYCACLRAKKPGCTFKP